MTTFKEMLAELERVCVSRNPLLADRLRPGLSPEKIRSKLRRLRVSGEIDSLVELYAWHDGTEFDDEYQLSNGLFHGPRYDFFQLELAAAHFRHFFPAAAATQPVLSEAIGRYFPVLWNGSVGWIAVDITPGENNRVVIVESGSTPGIREAYSSPGELIEDIIGANLENRTLKCFSRKRGSDAKRRQAGFRPLAGERGEAVEPPPGTVQSFVSEGGPHIVLPDLARDAWKGVSLDNYDVLDPSTDYGRACLVKEPVGLLSVGDQEALALAGSPPISAWMTAPKSGLIHLLVFERWPEEGPEELAEAIVPKLKSSDFSDTGLRWTVKSDGATLMSAADRPGSAYGFGEVRVPLRSSTYNILQARHEKRGEAFWIFRLAPVTR